MWFKDLFDRFTSFISRKFSRGLNFRRRRRRFKVKELQATAINVGIVVAVVLVAFLLVFTFFTSVKMAGVSMRPTIEDETNLLINRGRYLFMKPSHNHIVAFESLSNEQDTIYLKRVVAVPGDTVVIKGGRLFVNGEKYDDVADTESSVRKKRARAREDTAIMKNAQPERIYKKYNRARGRNRGGKA